MDWSKCCLCQQVTDEDLRNPFSGLPHLVTKHVEKGVYLTLHTNIPKFYALKQMPITCTFDPQRLDDGNGIFETLKLHKASSSYRGVIGIVLLTLKSPQFPYG